VKSSVSAVELRVLVRELDGLLAGCRFDKAYSLENGFLRFRFHARGEGAMDLVVAPAFMCVSGFEYPQLEQPKGFAMSLRKHLEGFIVESVRQHKFDRIAEIAFAGGGSRFTLVVELFSRGNAILCDQDGVIVAVLNRQKWRDRTLTPKREYVYPPEVENPLELGVDKFNAVLRRSEKGLAATLAGLGLGGFYAEEICLNAGVDKTKEAAGVAGEEAGRVYESFRILVGMIESGSVDASIVLNGGGGYVDVIPFDFRSYEGSPKRRFGSFNGAVDEYFGRLQSAELESDAGRELGNALGKLELMKGKQLEALERLKAKAAEHQRAGDLIFQNLGVVEAVVEQIRRARKQGLGDGEISEKFALGCAKGVAEARLFRKLDKNRLIVELE